MYVFATVVLLGLALAVVVDLVGAQLSRSVRAALTIMLGMVLTWVTNYSAFAGWGIEFRSGWMGPVATGLAIAGIAAVWREVLGFLGSRGRRTDDATEYEPRIPRHAA
jgi:hypothetical protein